MTDLERLIAAVEAGDRHLVCFVVAKAGWPGDPWPDNWLTVVDASFSGSLDAALALFNSLLPGCSASIDTDGTADIFTGEAGNFDGSLRCIGHSDVKDAPARAMLLATLRAYAATQEPRP